LNLRIIGEGKKGRFLKNIQVADNPFGIYGISFWGVMKSSVREKACPLGSRTATNQDN
jgi:hypothetical protein